MVYQEAGYVAALLGSSALGGVVAARLWSEDAGLPARLFVAVVAVHAVVGVLVAGSLLAPTRSVAVTLYGVGDAVSAGITPLWLLFALVFTRDRRSLPRWLVATVAVWFGAFALLATTNPLHNLLWSEYAVVGSSVPHVIGTPTGLYNVLVIPRSILYYVSLGLFGVHALSGPSVTRRQSALLFVGYLPPFFLVWAWAAWMLPGPLNGALVIGSTWSLAAVSWAVFRHQLFDLVPLARETVFSALDDAVLVVDDDLRVLDHNDIAADTFPWLNGGEGEPLRAVFGDLLADEDAAGDERFVSDLSTHDEDGPRHFSVRVSPLRVGGTVRGHALVVRDVTERRHRMRDLERQTEQLERFADTLSHDLRNPLTVARGRLEMAKKSEDLAHLDAVDQAHDRIEQIIEDLLALSREGQRVGELDRVELAAVFEDARDTTATGDATCTVADGADVVVYADRSRLQRVFENLLRNAVEHGPAGPDGGVTVTLGAHPEGFYVEDDGVGVAPAERENVFEYEFTTAEDGTGLGLAIVRAIAKAHGWTVEMTEGKEGGARVVFSGVETVETVEPEPEPAPARERLAGSET